MTRPGEAELSRLLHGAVAELPDTPDRFDQVAHRVRVRRRQHRIAMASAVGVLAVLAAAAIPVAAARHSAPTPAAKVAGCAPESATSINSSAPAKVPEGATSLTVCLFEFRGPRRWVRVLHSDVEQVAARLRALPLAPSNDVCDVGRPTYGFTFLYPTGREVPFRLELGGCGAVLDTAVVQPTLRLLDAQRLSDAAGRPVRAPSCPAPSGVQRPVIGATRFDPIANPPGLVPTYERVVTACRYGWQSSAPGSPPVLQGRASGTPSLSALLAAVNASNGVPPTSCPPPLTGGVDILLFADQAQGVVEVRVAHTPCAMLATQQQVGHATSTLLALLDGLLDRPGQTSVATALPPCSTALTTGTGPHPPVPAHPDQLRVCQGNNPVYDMTGPDAEQYARLIAAAPLAARCPPFGPVAQPAVRRLIFSLGRSVTVLDLTTAGDCQRLSTRDEIWLASPLLAAKLGG